MVKVSNNDDESQWHLLIVVHYFITRISETDGADNSKLRCSSALLCNGQVSCSTTHTIGASLGRPKIRRKGMKLEFMKNEIERESSSYGLGFACLRSRKPICTGFVFYSCQIKAFDKAWPWMETMRFLRITCSLSHGVCRDSCHTPSVHWNTEGCVRRHWQTLYLFEIYVFEIWPISKIANKVSTKISFHSW